MAYQLPTTKAPDPKVKIIGQLAEMVVSFIILYFVQRIFSWFVKPLISVFSYDGIKEMIEKKQEAREDFLVQIGDDAADPMFQFQLRFLEEIETYKDDQDTEVYKDWYIAWKNGQILDSKLRWVPEIYKEEGATFNPKFLEYLKIQYGLHGQASFIERARFLRTINRFYPEFSSSYIGLGQDIARYSEALTKEIIQKTIAKEIEKFDLPKEYTDYLKALSAVEIKKAIPYLKKCVELGYDAEAAVLAYEEDLEVTVEARALHVICNRGKLPAYVGLAFIRDEISNEEVEELVLFNRSIHRMHGDSLMEIQSSGFTLYEELIDEQLKKYRTNKLLACL